MKVGIAISGLAASVGARAAQRLVDGARLRLTARPSAAALREGVSSRTVDNRPPRAAASDQETAS